ncbi:MAG TPA: nitroreductase family protein [Candidatus Dormibacteraeota bacterium]|nr:nitroreductase family protein [Candidatus Dormibacteraeota bacterium]
MTNPVFEVVRTVLAVREFQGKPVPDEVMSRIVEAGHLTASASNAQPWHFVVVRSKDALGDLGAMVATGPYIAGAAAAVVVAYEKNNSTGVSDASRAIQSMILAAWADGVGSNWTGFGRMDGVRKKVGLPNTYEVLAVLPFGYPKRKLGKGRKNRKPLAEVVSSEQFGTPLA